MSIIDLVLYKAYSELRRDVASAYLGILWWVLEPIMYMTAFYLIFALGVRSGGEDFVVFLLCGLTAWKWFASTLVPASNSVVNYRGLINQVYLPKVALPFIAILVNFIKFLVVLSLLLVYLWYQGHGPAKEWLYLLPIIITEMTLIVGSSLFLASLVPFIRDLGVVISNMMLMMMFLSGIFFNISDFPPEMQTYFYLNPMVSIIESFRDVLLGHVQPDWLTLSAVFGFSVALISTGYVILQRYDRYYPKVMN